MPTYEFKCIRCGHEFEVVNCPIGTEKVKCFCQPPGWIVDGKIVEDDRRFAHRRFAPPMQTQVGAGVTKEYFDQGLGRRISSKRQLKREMAAAGVVEKGETSRRTRKLPTAADIDHAASRISETRVTEIKEHRERRDFEERQ